MMWIMQRDSIDLTGDTKGEPNNLTNSLGRRARASGMELCTEKSTAMTESTSDIGADTNMSGRKLEAVASLKYLGAILCKDLTCSAEIRIRIALAMAAMARLNRIW